MVGGKHINGIFGKMAVLKREGVDLFISNTFEKRGGVDLFISNKFDLL